MSITSEVSHSVAKLACTASHNRYVSPETASSGAPVAQQANSEQGIP